MNISILGTGWLGLPLATTLQEVGHQVKGSVTSQEKMQKLRDAAIAPYQIKVFAEGVQGDLTSFFGHAEIVIIDIPPKLRRDPEADFTGKAKRIITYLEKSPVEKVIYVSSTSVYEDQEDFPTYTEKDTPNASSKAVKQLIDVEKMFSKNENFKANILRFGGLIGSDRHPVTHLSGRKNIKNPKAPVNLIQQEDCIVIIEKIIEKEAWGETFNAAYPKHPTKEEYYSKIATNRNLALPKYDQKSPSKGKIIGSVNLEEILEFEFKEPI